MNPRIHNTALKMVAGAFLPPLQGSRQGGVFYPGFRLRLHPGLGLLSPLCGCGRFVISEDAT